MKITVNQIKETLSTHSKQINSFFDRKVGSVCMYVYPGTLLCLEHSTDGYFIFFQSEVFGKVFVSFSADYIYPTQKLYLQVDLLTKEVTGHLWDIYKETMLIVNETTLLDAIDEFSKQQTVYTFPPRPDVNDLERAVNGIKYLFMSGEFKPDLKLPISICDLA